MHDPSTGYAAFYREAEQIMQRAPASRGLTANTTLAEVKTIDVGISRLIAPESRPFADPVKLANQGPFDWNKYTPIEVVPEGNNFRVLDGMTRIENARRAGITTLPANVFTE